jgi:hypothetical protein
MLNKMTILFVIALVLPSPVLAQDESRELVVLLHGLARSSGCMEEMAASLEAAGFQVCNVDYPSTEHSVEKLALEKVLPVIRLCMGPEPRRVNFVTHSLGGIIVRQLKASGEPLTFGRVVMLGPPNKGSEVVDNLGGWALFRWINGPAGEQLGTGNNALPKKLGSINLDLGVIAGHDTINPILSCMIPGDDDGKVSIENAKIDGMDDFLVVPVSHPFLMKDKEVIRQTILYLQRGSFAHDSLP